MWGRLKSQLGGFHEALQSLRMDSMGLPLELPGQPRGLLYLTCPLLAFIQEVRNMAPCL